MIPLHMNRAFAQFSPGDLSRAHQTLEGSQKCTQCHELGKEISGEKCLGCHTEIKQQLDKQHGFHFKSSADQCITCHKEHLGRDAKTMLFDENTFDHTRTGFTLTGKHAVIACERCHTPNNIKDPAVQKVLSEFPHKSFLGLDAACISCHKDPHRGQFKQECSSCHTTTTWKQIQNFDHSKTNFTLLGKHVSVSCSKCHTSLLSKQEDHEITFKVAAYADCTPCHNSPHTSKFEGRECKSCHSAENWGDASKKSFNHNLTSFILKGKHTTVGCEKCHPANEKKSIAKPFGQARQKCIECHTDKHNGEFKKTYANDCSTCHTELGFKPSTFSMAKHESVRFKLTSSHAAVSCTDCHYRAELQSLVFHFNNLDCETCHKDVHKKQFTKIMGNGSCDKCHSTNNWHAITYDHSSTKFKLDGKHSSTPCSKCHVTDATGKISSVVYKGLSLECESCHKDPHEKQFAISGKTECKTCHSTEQWHSLTFQHETQSKFSLKGAHKNVPCASCHRPERNGNNVFSRYKPLSTTCESCHQGRNFEQ